MPTRAAIVATARRYLGTPYHHQGALAGAGCDCLGLVRGVWRDLYGAEPEVPPPYTPDWGEVGGVEHILAASTRHMLPVAPSAAAAGDVLVFRLKPNTVAKHIAIRSAPLVPEGSARMIHAQSNDAVREVALSPWWTRRLIAAFGFPDLVD